MTGRNLRRPGTGENQILQMTERSLDGGRSFCYFIQRIRKLPEVQRPAKAAPVFSEVQRPAKPFRFFRKTTRSLPSEEGGVKLMWGCTVPGFLGNRALRFVCVNMGG